MNRLAIFSLLLAGLPLRAEEGVAFFEKRIRPILAEHCYSCHSADAKKLKAELRLDGKAHILKGGESGLAVVPGEVAKGLLLKAIRYDDVELRMPPKGKLDSGKIADLVAWVKMGAPMPDDGAATGGAAKFDMEKRRKHWSFQPVGKPAIPDLPGSNPIDAFLEARRRAAGVAASPEADRRTLTRRLTFDLTGLPPTRDELAAALADKSEHWYENVVERLLASPAYGERWGRHWLDLTRYADTLGHEFDFELPFAFMYRDYVVRALNADIPYDRFLVEHVAGDLLPDPRRHARSSINESILATGFFFLGEGKHSPVDIRAEGAERIDNQIDVLSKTFLGLTVSRARCHDHKFDAIRTRDYYALAGYLRSSRFQLVDVGPTEPIRAIAESMQKELEKAQKLAVAVSSARLESALGRVGEEERARFLKSWAELARLPLQAKPDAFKEARRTLAKEQKAQLARAAESKPFADFDGEDFGGWFVQGQAWGDRPMRAADVVVIPADPLPAQRLIGPGGATSGRLGVRLNGVLRSPTFTISAKHIHFRVAGRNARVNLIINGFQQIQDPIYGGLRFGVNHGDDPRWHTMNVAMWVGHRAYVECIDDSDGYMMLDRVVFVDGGAPPEPPNALLAELLDNDGIDSPDKLSEKLKVLLAETLAEWRKGKIDARPDRRARAALVNRMLANESLRRLAKPIEDEETSRQAMGDHMQRRSELEATLPAPIPAMALTDGSGENERVFIRGNHKTLGEEAPRSILEALRDGAQAAPKEGSGRLELARRMADPANPLTARVIVNRLWHHHFGMGLVRTPDDFGHQGQKPTHPELLDYLAARFTDDGWSLKAMHRLMVTSSAYRMASKGDAKADEADPENKLWHKYPVRRLEAEAIRDSILAVSGRLDRRLGGVGVMPHLTPHMQGRGRPGHSGPLDGEGRRSLYINVRRNFLTPLFLAFDYPVPFTTIGRRSVSNVPAQALALMNNPLVRQESERWAKQVFAEADLTPRERVILLYESAFARMPDEEELAAAVEFLREQGAMDSLRSWAELCHVLMNVKEFIFLN